MSDNTTGIPQVGRIIVSDTLPDVEMATDASGNPVSLKVGNPCGSDSPDVSVQLYQYCGPGSEPTSVNNPNHNFPFTVNGSSSFDQPVTSNDFWTNFMFRYTSDQITEEDTVRKDNNINCDSINNPLAFVPNYFGTSPWMANLTNTVFSTPNTPWRQGVALFNNYAGQIVPENIEGSPTSALGKYGIAEAITIGIGPGAGASDRTGEITPFGVAGEANDGNTRLLNAKIDSYSDWGAKFTYGDGTNSLSTHMMNGSPFVFFKKTGKTATAKAWIMGQDAPSGQETRVTVWLNQDNILGVTTKCYMPPLTPTTTDSMEILSSYVLIAPTGNTWTKADGDENQEKLMQLWTSDLEEGTIAVAAMPHHVGETVFESLTADQKIAVANYFAGLANEAEKTSSSFTVDRSNNTLESTLSFAPSGSKETLTVLLPHQTKYLSSSNTAATKHTISGVGEDLSLTYSCLIGKGTLYKGSSFSTEMQFYGLLPQVPNPGLYSSSDQANTLYDSLKTWMTDQYLASSGTKVINYDTNTYITGALQIGESIMLFDALRKGGKLSDDDAAQALVYRDYLINDMKRSLASWFDLSSSRLFQYMPKYNTFVGFPTGFGAANNFNDMHFHYAYYLQGFAIVGQFDPDFVTAYSDVIDLLIRQVAANDSTESKFPRLRYFNPYQGHCWANGVSATQESVAESLLFSSGLIKIGQMIGGTKGSSWEELGIYLYTSEIRSAMEYWFNVDQTNWASTYGLSTDTTVKNIKQASIIESIDVMRQVNFGDATKQNVVQAVDGINWIAPSANSLWFGLMPNDYLQANWAEFVKNNNASSTKASLYENVVAFFQSQLEGSGTTKDDPGPAGALARLAAHPDLAENLYAGTNNTIVQNILYALQNFGVVDQNVIADHTNFAAFKKSGVSTYCTYNPTSTAIDTVTFKDLSGTTVTTITAVEPGQMVVKSGDDPELRYTFGGGTSSGHTLYLRKESGTRSLKSSAGTAGPTDSFQPSNVDSGKTADFSAEAIKTAYASTYDTIPARSDNGAGPPSDDSLIIEFVSDAINGTLIEGGKTDLALFANLDMNPGKLKDMRKQGFIFVVQVAYDATGAGTFSDRVENYMCQYSPGFNLWTLFDNSVCTSTVKDATNPAISLDTATGTLPVTMTNGKVRIRVFSGPYPSTTTSQDSYLSVESHAVMARQSRMRIPYTVSS